MSNLRNLDQLLRLDEQDKLDSRLLKGPECKTAFALRENVIHAIDKQGLDKCAFTTITFPPGTSLDEAKMRFRKFNENSLNSIFPARVYGWDLTRPGQEHIHLIGLYDQDIRSGLDMSVYEEIQQIGETIAAEKRKSSKAERHRLGVLKKTFTSNRNLKMLEKSLRTAGRACGAGKIEVMPIIKTAAHAAGYLRKRYIESVIWKYLRPKGLRLIGYSKNFPKRIYLPFSWNSERSRKYHKMKDHIIRCLGRTQAEMADWYGRHWIMDVNFAINELYVEYGDDVSLWDTHKVRWVFESSQ